MKETDPKGPAPFQIYRLVLLPDKLKGDITRDIEVVDMGYVCGKGLRNFGVVCSIFLGKHIVAGSLCGEDQVSPGIYGLERLLVVDMVEYSRIKL